MSYQQDPMRVFFYACKHTQPRFTHMKWVLYEREAKLHIRIWGHPTPEERAHFEEAVTAYQHNYAPAWIHVEPIEWVRPPGDIKKLVELCKSDDDAKLVLADMLYEEGFPFTGFNVRAMMHDEIAATWIATCYANGATASWTTTR